MIKQDKLDKHTLNSWRASPGTGAAFAGMIEIETTTRKAKGSMKFDRMVTSVS
jgi:hypothetical protein